MIRIFSSSARVEVAAPVDKVFNYLGDLTRRPQWAGGGLASVEKTSEGPVGVGSNFTFVVRPYGDAGGTSRLKVVVTGYVPNERIAFEGRETVIMRHQFIELQPSGSGTRVTMGTVVSGSVLWLPVILLLYISALVAWPLIKWLESRRLCRLKARLESLP